MSAARGRFSHKESFINLLICILIPFCSATKFQKVGECRSDISAWSGRETIFNCSTGSQYHCILNIHDILYELCMKAWPVSPKVVGCPVVGGLETGNPQLALPYSECPENITGCPQKEHDLYYTNELYQYPTCFISKDKRSFTKQPPPTTNHGEEIVSVTHSPTKEDENTALIAIFAVSVLLAIVIVIVLSLIFRRISRESIWRKRRTKERDEQVHIETHELLNDIINEADDQTRVVIETSNEWTSSCYQTLVKLKRSFWIQLEVVKGEQSWTDFFDDEIVKHLLFHQWKNVICCKCESAPELYRRRFLSNKGWESLYNLHGKECQSDYDDCACKYSLKEIDVTKISLASLLCTVYTVGQLSRNGRRCVTEIRHCCEKIMQMTLADVPEEVLSDLNTLVSVFELNSNITASVIEDSSEDKVEPFSAKEHYRTDMCDLSPLQLNEVNEDTVSRFEARTREVIEEDTFYVSVPRWEKEANKRILEDKFVIITGYVGEGKSTLCRQVLKQFAENFSAEDVVLLKLEPSQTKFQFLHQLGRPCLVYFEDFLGTSQYTKLYSKEKYTFYKDCLESIKRYKKIHIICCVRSIVLEEANFELEKFGDPLKYTMNLSTRWRLTKEEILNELDEYQKEFGKVLFTEDEKSDIAGKASEISFVGFQECCALCFKSNQGKRVFYHPVVEVEREIERLQDLRQFEFYILVYVLLTNTPFNTTSVDYGLLEEIDGTSALDSLKKRSFFKFVRKDVDNTYTVQHQFILEAVLRVFGKNNSKKLLSLATDEVVIRYLRPSSYVPKNEQEVFLCLSEDLDKELAKRLLKAYNYRHISVHTSARDKRFVKNHLIQALEDMLLVRQQDDQRRNEEVLSMFVENTIKDVVTEAVKEGCDIFLDSLIQRYSDVPLERKQSEAVSHSHCQSGMTPLNKIEKCFLDCLTCNIAALPKTIQQKAAILKSRFSNGS